MTPRRIALLAFPRLTFLDLIGVYDALRRVTPMGIADDVRVTLVGTEPEKFLMPTGGDLRFNWVIVRLAAIDIEEMRELVFDAWRWVVPKKLAAAYDERFFAGEI